MLEVSPDPNTMSIHHVNCLRVAPRPHIWLEGKPVCQGPLPHRAQRKGPTEGWVE